MFGFCTAHSKLIEILKIIIPVQNIITPCPQARSYQIHAACVGRLTIRKNTYFQQVHKM